MSLLKALKSFHFTSKEAFLWIIGINVICFMMFWNNAGTKLAHWFVFVLILHLLLIVKVFERPNFGAPKSWVSRQTMGVVTPMGSRLECGGRGPEPIGNRWPSNPAAFGNRERWRRFSHRLGPFAFRFGFLPLLDGRDTAPLSRHFVIWLDSTRSPPIGQGR